MSGPSRQFYGFEAEPLQITQTLLEGESLLSWIARSAIEYELPNITTIMRDVGQVHRNRVADVMRKEIDVEGLAVILGSDVETIQALRADDLGGGSVRYLGSVIATADVHTQTRLFSPATLADDPEPFYRASWLLRTFPVCTTSWQTLRSSCDCGAEQTWGTVSTMVLCESCGSDLRDLHGEIVPEEARPGLARLAAMLFGDGDARAAATADLPDALRGLDPGEIHDLAVVMARIVDPTLSDPRGAVRVREPLRLALALSKAAELLPDWPRTPWLALAASGDVRAMQPRCRPLQRLFRVLNRDIGTRLAPSLSDELEHMRLAITLDAGHAVEGLVDLNDAEVILHKTKRDVRAARKAGHLEPRFVIRRGEILPGYDRTELEGLVETLGWPSAGTIGKRLGVPPYGVEQLCAMDEMVWAKTPHRTLREGLFLDPASVDAIAARLRASASEIATVKDPVSLNSMMRGVGGREKPWGPVLRHLLEGGCPYSVSLRGTAVRDIRVPAAEVDRLRELAFERKQWTLFPFAETIVQNDACDILNVSLRSRAVLSPYRAAAYRTAWIFDRGEVERLALEIVTPKELHGRNAGTVPTVVAIRRAGLVPMAFGYAREGALAAFVSASAGALEAMPPWQPSK